MTRHVTFVVPNLAIGGLQRRTIRYANELVRRGYRVTFLVIGSADDMARELSPDIDCHIFGGRAASPLVIFRLMRQIKALSPDVTYGVSTFANLLVCLAGIVAGGGRIVISDVSYPPIEWKAMPFVRRNLVRLLSRVLYPFAHVVTANSDESLAALRRIAGPGPRYSRVFNPIDYKRIQGLSQEPFDDPEPREIQEKIILAVGRLHNVQKGFDMLLDACRDLLGHPKPWKLWVIGAGPDEEALQQQANANGLQDRIRWLGRKDNPFPYLRRADIVVVPSRFEGFPNVLLEAMVLGKATVACDCMCGPRELTDGGKHGLLTPVDDAPAMAAAIARLLEDDGLRADLGQAARSHVHDIYSDAMVFGRLVEVVQ